MKISRPSLLLIALLVCACPNALAQDYSSMLQQLSPEQRQAALAAIGSRGGQGLPGGSLGQQQQLNPSPSASPSPKPGPRNTSEIEKDAVESLDKASLTEKQEANQVSQKLRQFGYDLFEGVPTTFAPVTDIPVPSDYIIGPDDTINIQLFGKDNEYYTLVVSREGNLNIPGIGPISVAGLRYSELTRKLERVASQQMIGVKASITMGPLRSIRVFVLGDANRPGSYTVSSLSTMTNALFVSGGIKPIGSLRNIQLKRNGKVVTNLDLYDLLLKGDTSKDQRLYPGDVLFVPPIGHTVGVAGEVRRPAIYELLSEQTADEALNMAGGVLPTAFPQASQLERISDQGARTIVDIDLTTDAGKAVKLHSGDTLRVYSVLERMDDMVMLSGHVERPGGYQWNPGMRLSDLIPSVERLLPQPDLEYVLVKREVLPERTIVIRSANLKAALEAPKSEKDLALEPRDEIIVFSSIASRETALGPVLTQVRKQARSKSPEPIVAVRGNVKFPGEYPLEGGMRVSDLVRAAGGLDQAAFENDSELSRYLVNEKGERTIQRVPVNLLLAQRKDAASDVQLQPFDTLIIRTIPFWREKETVEIRGEVLFPGTYVLERGETLSSVLRRAGGLSERAYPRGAVLSREELRKKEAEEVRRLMERLRADLASSMLQNAQSTTEQQASTAQQLAFTNSLLSQLETYRPIGRLVIDLASILSEGAAGPDVVLKHGDLVVIPDVPQEVTVLGEVNYPTSHFFRPDSRTMDYVNVSGGTTYKADEERTYVVRANGEIVANAAGGWFSDGAEIQRGDTVVVPMDVDRVRPLTYWSSISQIVYQLGVAAAAWHTVGLF